ncbi:MAG: hypothetical protein CVV18_01000 [Gammaproteobacteria bacterium HGW-Gammaproteobacteria-8]|nr:MAG: hypothetical protein CVV18_01000 [Gammaproteobacteria bacterium HGW-Gammaproteobacteria-8]
MRVLPAFPSAILLSIVLLLTSACAVTANPERVPDPLFGLGDRELFSTFVAVNPALHANLAYFHLLEPQPDAAPSSLVVALGTEDEPRYRLPALDWLGRRPVCLDCSLTLEVLELPGGHHASSAPAGYFEVVRRVFPSAAMK